jgi:hypothetical protein
METPKRVSSPERACRRPLPHGHNYWVKTTGVYYFPGMYTAILPMIPGLYTIRRVITGSRRRVAATKAPAEQAS